MKQFEQYARLYSNVSVSNHPAALWLKSRDSEDFMWIQELRLSTGRLYGWRTGGREFGKGFKETLLQSQEINIKYKINNLGMVFE